MSTHEWRMAHRKAVSEARAKESAWARKCREAGFHDDEVGGVTVRMLHERLHGPVGGRPLTELVRR